jgi:hypothetical protein
MSVRRVTAKTKIFELKIVLQDVRPTVSRRVQVPGKTTLAESARGSAGGDGLDQLALARQRRSCPDRLRDRRQAVLIPVAMWFDHFGVKQCKGLAHEDASAVHHVKAGEELLLAQAAYPSRIEFPAAVRISFLDSNGQQWSRTPSRLALNRYASRCKPGRLRGRARSQAHVFCWKETLGERTINGPATT